VSLGLAPPEAGVQGDPAIKAEGTTVLIVEQDVNQALAVADRFAFSKVGVAAARPQT
jgi:branched-chain amino acid transport system ATP-binding protein